MKITTATVPTLGQAVKREMTVEQLLTLLEQAELAADEAKLAISEEAEKLGVCEKALRKYLVARRKDRTLHLRRETTAQQAVLDRMGVPDDLEPDPDVESGRVAE